MSRSIFFLVLVPIKVERRSTAGVPPAFENLQHDPCFGWSRRSAASNVSELTSSVSHEHKPVSEIKLDLHKPFGHVE